MDCAATCLYPGGIVPPLCEIQWNALQLGRGYDPGVALHIQVIVSKEVDGDPARSSSVSPGDQIAWLGRLHAGKQTPS